MEHSRLLKFVLPDNHTTKMAENPTQVEAEVPSSQQLRGDNTEVEDIKPMIISSFTEVHPEVQDNEKVVRHNKVIKNEKRIERGISTEEKKQTKIPIAKFKESVDKVKVERRRRRKKSENESHIPVRRSASLPKATNPEDEFDKLFQDIADEKGDLETKFEEIIQDYDNNTNSLDSNEAKKSKIPYFMRRSGQNGDSKENRSTKMIAARDKVRLRKSISNEAKYESAARSIVDFIENEGASEKTNKFETKQSNDHVKEPTLNKLEANIDTKVDTVKIIDEVTNKNEDRLENSAAINDERTNPHTKQTVTENNELREDFSTSIEKSFLEKKLDNNTKSYQNEAIQHEANITFGDNSTTNQDFVTYTTNNVSLTKTTESYINQTRNVESIEKSNENQSSRTERFNQRMLSRIDVNQMKETNMSEHSKSLRYNQNSPESKVVYEKTDLKENLQDLAKYYANAYETTDKTSNIDHFEAASQITSDTFVDTKQFQTEQSKPKDLKTQVYKTEVREITQTFEKESTHEIKATLSYTGEIFNNISQVTESNYSIDSSVSYNNLITNTQAENTKHYKTNTEIKLINKKNDESESRKEINSNTKNLTNTNETHDSYLPFKNVKTNITANKFNKKEQDDKKTDTLNKKEILNEPNPKEKDEDKFYLSGKVSRIISKIHSKELNEEAKSDQNQDKPKKRSILSKIAIFERQEETVPNSNKKPNLPALITKNIQTERVHVHTPLIVNEVFKFQDNITLEDGHNKDGNPVNVSANNEMTTENYKELYSECSTAEITETNMPFETTADAQAKSDFKWDKILDSFVLTEEFSKETGETEKKCLFEMPKDIEPKSPLYKEEVTTPVSDAPVIIPNIRPIREILHQFEHKNDEVFHNHKNITTNSNAIDYNPNVNENNVEITTKTYPIEEEKDIIKLDDSASKILPKLTIHKGDFTTNNMEDRADRSKEPLKEVQNLDSRLQNRTKSLAEFELEVAKGTVNKLIVRMKSYDRILDKKEVINAKELPRKRLVSEKIAMFERKTLPVQSETAPAPKMTLTFPKPTPALQKTTPVTSILKPAGTTSISHSLTTPTSLLFTTPPADEESLQRKIDELLEAKKYGKIEVPTIELRNGEKMPLLAVGTALMDPRLIRYIISAAIDMGYRAFDTAYIYGNEKEVGEAIRAKIDDGTVKREELFIISKLWSTFHRTDLVEGACRASLQAMGLDYFDLYLIHNPMSLKEGSSPFPKIATVLQYSEHDYLSAWYGMEKLPSAGLVKTLGVSNFNSVQLQRILDRGRIKPAVNQVECHPYLSQQRLDHFCADRQITFSCFGVLGSKGTPADLRGSTPAVIDDPLVKVMASGLGVSPAQLLISYQIHCGHAVVVKSSSAAHLWDNLQALKLNLTSGQIEALHTLNRNKRIFTFVGMGDTHKNYPFNIAF